jgi:hypothetical protein
MCALLIERTAGQAPLKDVKAKSQDTSPVDLLLFASVRALPKLNRMYTCALLTYVCRSETGCAP